MTFGLRLKAVESSLGRPYMHRPAKKTKWNELRHDQGRDRHRVALLILGLHSAADAESSGVADALSRPDALAEELVGWGCSLGEAGAAATPPSVSAPKHDATDDERAGSENRAMGAGTHRSGSPAFCGSRKAMNKLANVSHMADAKEFEKSPTAPDYRPTTTDSNHSRVHPCTEQNFAAIATFGHDLRRQDMRRTLRLATLLAAAFVPLGATSADNNTPDQRLVSILKKGPVGIEQFNHWRRLNPIEEVNLRGADLRDAMLRGTDLRLADLRNADLRGAVFGLSLADELANAKRCHAGFKGREKHDGGIQSAMDNILHSIDSTFTCLSGPGVMARVEKSAANLRGANLGGSAA